MFSKESLKKQYQTIDSPLPNDFIFTFQNHKIYLIDGKSLPQWQEVSNYFIQPATFYCFAESETHRYLIAETIAITENKHYFNITLKSAFSILEDKAFALAKHASHLAYWRLTHQYCGICGGKNTPKNDEQAFICSQCQHITYPRISPCIIVLITHGKKLLLARSPHFPENIYSTLAGFVEPGESLEETAHREIKEEVGVTVSNLTYFGSQPWPFPDSLMIAFHAEYLAGDIVIDGIEIEDAKWFESDALPQLPAKSSIGRKLIDAFLERGL